MKEKIYQLLPDFFQGFLISLFNFNAYSVRYGKKYNYFIRKLKKNQSLTLEELKQNQIERFNLFYDFVRANSKFYKYYPDVSIEELSSLPIVSKELLRENIKDVYTINKGVISKTGGTTGKSLEVIFTKDNMQERFALLDTFRSQFGYKLGKKTAWFSGKSLLTNKDVSRRRFWKTDYYYNVRYYSTFHIKKDYLKYYVENLIKFSPEFLVGFPSTILEIASYGINNNYEYPKNQIKAIFPTAETVTCEMREIIERFFNAKIYNQYASSEGAPFIFECIKGNLHLELQSGIFEVLDENDNPSNIGRLIVTSFTTQGTPLIRYDIGDYISLKKGNDCLCGNNNPIVDEIFGRIDDFLYSPDNGKINLGNVSNTLKDTKGIIKFQAIQNELNFIEILLVKDPNIYNSQIESKFLKNWRDRLGNNMKIKIQYVEDLPVEKSGKYRIIKNNIKHLM
ncbi:phenylacetate--CoA ligase family protein [Flavobacterium sp.]|uniref:phenylacetate--CoA ligase family protein n=1 Tax=Flavobacterium sp. TaxID=239 RepID=UPI003A927525